MGAAHEEVQVVDDPRVTALSASLGKVSGHAPVEPAEFLDVSGVQRLKACPAYTLEQGPEALPLLSIRLDK